MKALFRNLTALLIIISALSAGTAYAMTPSLYMSVDSSNSNTIDMNVVGDANSGVIMYYYSSNASGLQGKYIGTTNSTGNFSTSFGVSDYDIVENSNVSVSVNNQTSSPISWSYGNAVSSNFSLSQSSVVLNAGQSSTLTAQNTGSQLLYLSSNTNPQVANVSFSGNQITVTGLSAGQTTANVCLINSSSNSNCASIYVIVQSSSNTLNFSRNNVSVVSGQSVQISISGGNGFYTAQYNSAPSIIGTSFNGPTLTLSAIGTTGSSTITVCSTDSSACGVITASIGTYSSTGLTFSNNNAIVITGQTQNITVYGGSGNYYVSSNSNTNSAQTYISTSSLVIYGNTPGNSSITVCSVSGNCGTVSVTVSGASGGAINLSQNNLSLTAGQVISISVTGGTMPYAVIQNNDGKASYSLNGQIVTITGISQGASSASVCSNAGGCITLNVNVNGNGTTVSTVQPTFSQNNVVLGPSQTAAVYLVGNGGYFISNNSNPGIVSGSISGSSIVLTGIAAGSANLLVCQTGGQCNSLYVSVGNAVSNVSAAPITFDQNSVSLYVGGNKNVNIYGGSGVGYYISYNSNPNAVGVYVSGSALNITGNQAGSAVLSVCSSSNVCSSISVSILGVTTTTTTSSSASSFAFTEHLQLGYSGTAVTQLQAKLRQLGYFTYPTDTGYFGSVTVAAVKALQKAYGLDQLGQVGPGTRALLNRL